MPAVDHMVMMRLDTAPGPRPPFLAQVAGRRPLGQVQKGFQGQVKQRDPIPGPGRSRRGKVPGSRSEQRNQPRGKEDLAYIDGQIPRPQGE